MVEHEFVRLTTRQPKRLAAVGGLRSHFWKFKWWHLIRLILGFVSLRSVRGLLISLARRED